MNKIKDFWKFTKEKWGEKTPWQKFGIGFCEANAFLLPFEGKWFSAAFWATMSKVLLYADKATWQTSEDERFRKLLEIAEDQQMTEEDRKTLLDFIQKAQNQDTSK